MKKILYLSFLVVPMLFAWSVQAALKNPPLVVEEPLLQSHQEKMEQAKQKSSEAEGFAVLKKIAARIQKRYDAMSSLRFSFHQQTSGELTGRPQRGSGWAAFLRKQGGQKMRWEYDSPDMQVIVGNTETLSMYFQKLKQMIVTDAASMQTDLTYAFFSGRGNLLRDFTIESPDKPYADSQTESIAVLKLTPRLPQQHLEYVHLWVDAEGIIRRICMNDHFGTITMLNFSNIQVDALASMDEGEVNQLFTFTPPEDTEIIQQ